MKCPTIHLMIDDMILCGAKKAFYSENPKHFLKQLQPCGRCLNKWANYKNKNQKVKQ